jgi:threonine/homoserine/homoserine lactone efflux protein
VGKVQTGKVAGQFIKHVVPAIAKPARALWNQVIGFIFICLGVSFGFTVLRYARRGEAFQVIVSSIATLLMLYYGVSSFLRARKISRS